MPTLSIIACGAPLAARAPDLVTAATSQGWETTLTVTAAAAHTWLPNATTTPSRTATAADAVVVCPLTFNTANKLAAGICDTPILGHLTEALTTRPIIAVPMLKHALWDHPTWRHTLHWLTTAGVILLDPATGRTPPAPVASGTGTRITADFNPAWPLGPVTSHT